jgi:hypothetical protein
MEKQEKFEKNVTRNYSCKVLQHHLSISWARWVQFVPFNPISLRSILILSSSLCFVLLSRHFPSGFKLKFHTYFSSPPCRMHALPILSSF